VLVAIASTLSMAPTEPEAADAPADVFSAGRALRHIEAIADSPRPIGSAKHAEARAYLVGVLGSLGWRTEVQESVGMFDFGNDGTQNMAAVANVIATKPGSQTTGTVLLTAHYDTVAGSPGAADDGIGIGVLLETARALNTAGALRNDVGILLTDAEEASGLHGAEAFVASEWEPSAPPSCSITRRAVPAEPRSHSACRHRTGNSSTRCRRRPARRQNRAPRRSSRHCRTTPTSPPFSQAGLHSYDTGIAADGAYYHSPLDDPAHLGAASLQQMGDTTLDRARELAGTNLAAIAEGDEEIVTTFPWGLFRYPQGLEVPLALGTLFLTAVLVWLLRRRGALTLPRLALSALACVICLVATGAAGYAVWRVALLADPGQASAENAEPYESMLYRLAVLLAGLGVVLGLYAILRRRLHDAELATGMLIVLGLVGVLLSVTLPGVSGLVVQPSLVVAAGGVLAALLLERAAVAAIAYLLALAVAAMMLGPAVWTGFDIDLGTGAPASAAQLAMFVLLALPLIEVAWPHRPGLPPRRLHAATVPAVLLVLAVMFTAGGLVANREGATDARQEMVRYSVDADTGHAYWASWASTGERMEPLAAERTRRAARRRLPLVGWMATLARTGASGRPTLTRGDRRPGPHRERQTQADAAPQVPTRRHDARAVNRRRQRHNSQRDRRRPCRPQPIGPGASGPSVFGTSEHRRKASRCSWNSTSARKTSCFASRTAPMISVPCQATHRQTVACSLNRRWWHPGARPMNSDEVPRHVRHV
jgi:uncharacterized membrane protein YhaH (DUF805 family)